MMKKFKWSYLYLFIVFLLLYLPIFYLIFYSFNDGGTMNNFTGFTWDHYQAVFEDTRLIIIVLNTFMLAFLSALIATIIGTFGAMGIYYTKKRQARTTLLSMNNILLVSPDVIIGASFLIFFTFLGFGLGFQSVLLSHMAFTYSLDDFAVTFFVTGNGFTTLSVEIYSRARQGISLEINALSALVFLFSMVLVIGYYFISKENRSKKLRKNRRGREEVARLR